MRTSNGCWTCRVRRKKCDETLPICEVCSALSITCHFDLGNKPEWMDGNKKQEAMAEQFKREVKEMAHRRREERVAPTHDELKGFPGTIALGEVPTSMPDLPRAISDIPNGDTNSDDHSYTVQHQPVAHPVTAGQATCDNTNSERSDAFLFVFYLEKLFPFLFPFYNPPLLQGGKAWILEMMIRRPVVRQAILCQSFYFCVAWGTTGGDAAWEKVLVQTREAFDVLRQALHFIEGSHLEGHIHGAVRIMSSILQLQRFEVAVLSFDNWQAHLNAALALFRQLLDSPSIAGSEEPKSRFNTVMSRLGSTSPNQCPSIPTAEQAAFRFSSALLIFDDIIASTVLQEQPRLYEYHHSLLDDNEGDESPINLEAVIGVKNPVLRAIGDIAALEAWKQQCRAAGTLDNMKLARRAFAIREWFGTYLMQLESQNESPPDLQKSENPLDVFTAGIGQPSEGIADQGALVSLIWAHAALSYLFVVVSGWQLANTDLRFHVYRVIELLRKVSPAAYLRTMMWPFCVAGCLAEAVQEDEFRSMVKALPPSLFGTVHKSLEMMESVWRKRHSGDIESLDLAACFRSESNPMLLV